jgi:hypothetical protein
VDSRELWVRAEGYLQADMRSSDLKARYDVIVLPDMAKDQLMDGFHTGMVPGQYAGGIGPDGVDNLRAFVRDGGMLVATNRTAANLIPLMSLPLGVAAPEHVVVAAKATVEDPEEYR